MLFKIMVAIRVDEKQYTFTRPQVYWIYIIECSKRCAYGTVRFGTYKDLDNILQMTFRKL